MTTHLAQYTLDVSDVGQTGTEGFVVLADPEDNEFCVLDGPPS
ncbi:hypothetical protein [Micromonospora terminaliae]|nr:hypothetical protein [Micromonospora terminaliae]